MKQGHGLNMNLFSFKSQDNHWKQEDLQEPCNHCCVQDMNNWD